MLTKDLENGMVAEFEEGFLGIFLGNTFITYYVGGIEVTSNPDEEVACFSRNIIKIIKPTYHNSGGVYAASIDYWLKDKEFLKRPHKVVYDANPQPVEMTIPEIEQKLGVINLKIIN